MGTVWTNYRPQKRVSFIRVDLFKSLKISVEDVIDFAEKENEKLVLKITEWRKVRVSTIFDQKIIFQLRPNSDRVLSSDSEYMSQSAQFGR